MDGTAVAFYSLFGLTLRIAEDISLLTGATLIRIVPQHEYSFDDNTASKEIRNQIERGYCPELAGAIPDFSEFESVFIGSPNWFRTVAPPVLTLVRKSNLKGKRIIPFCAHGGGGLGDIVSKLRSEMPSCQIERGAGFGQTYTLDELRGWLDTVGIDHE